MTDTIKMIEEALAAFETIGKAVTLSGEVYSYNDWQEQYRPIMHTALSVLKRIASGDGVKSDEIYNSMPTGMDDFSVIEWVLEYQAEHIKMLLEQELKG